MYQWQLQTAKAKLSTVVKKAQSAPQGITVRGDKKAVIMSKEYYDRLTNKNPSFVDFMQNSPLFGVSLPLKRENSSPRPIQL